MTRVADWPVAREADPITSTLAGEDRQARQESRDAVLSILRRAKRPLSQGEIVARYKGPLTEQRIRSACTQLERMGLVERVGKRAGSSPTGKAAMTWQVAR